MINSIILLHNQTFAKDLAKELQKINPSVEVIWVSSLARLLEIPKSTLEYSRLISFISGVIVPLPILKSIGYGCYNFHPAPPSRPGFASMEMAIYEGDKVFGVTLHAMDELVDTGPICAFSVFPIDLNMTAFLLHDRVTENLFKLFIQSSQMLLNEDPLLELPITWGTRKFTKAQYFSLLRIHEDISQSDLDLRIRAFGYDYHHKIKYIDSGEVYEIKNSEMTSETHDLGKFVEIRSHQFIHKRSIVFA